MAVSAPDPNAAPRKATVSRSTVRHLERGRLARMLPRRGVDVDDPVPAEVAGVFVVLMCPSPVESAGYLGETPGREKTPVVAHFARQVSEILDSLRRCEPDQV